MRQQSGADEQNDGQRHLRDDERAPDVRACAAASLRARRRRQRFANVTLRSMPRGEESHRDRCSYRDKQCEREDCPVEVNFVGTRQITRLHGEQRTHAERGEHNAGNATGQRKYPGLCEELLKEPVSAGAQRETKPDLVSPNGHSRDEEIDHVRARDKEQEGR